MHSPGVEVRPLRQITGEAEFNEIFFTDVEVPVENVVGEIGGGWQVAMTTLLHERGTLGFALVAGLEGQIRKLITLAKESGATTVQRDAIAREWIELQARALHELPRADDADEDRHPGPGRLGREALVVGGEPAGDEARARAARPGGAAPRRTSRLLAAPAAALPRQHDRGRHLRDPAQHHRRARARAPEGRADGVRVQPGAGGAAARGALVPRGESGRAARGAARARLARRVRSGGSRRRRALVPRRGDPVRGGWAARSTPAPS